MNRTEASLCEHSRPGSPSTHSTAGSSLLVRSSLPCLAHSVRAPCRPCDAISQASVSGCVVGRVVSSTVPVVRLERRRTSRRGATRRNAEQLHCAQRSDARDLRSPLLAHFVPSSSSYLLSRCVLPTCASSPAVRQRAPVEAEREGGADWHPRAPCRATHPDRLVSLAACTHPHPSILLHTPHRKQRSGRKLAHPQWRSHPQR